MLLFDTDTMYIASFLHIFVLQSFCLSSQMITHTRVPHLKAVSVRLEAKTHVTFVALEPCALPQFFEKFAQVTIYTLFPCDMLQLVWCSYFFLLSW